MIKRKLSLALVLAMLLSLMIPTVAFGAVKDYSGHWAEKTIQYWFDNNMLKGYEDGTFRPDAQITRAEFMTMVNNAFEFTEKTEVDFDDVDSDDWFYADVQKAVKAGYMIGYEDNTARPGNKITRQEAALIIARIKNLDNHATGANKFADDAEIAAWAKGGVGAVADEKFMIGYEDNTFRPLRFISRAEAVVTIDRALDKAVEEPSTGGGSSGPGSSSKDPFAILEGLTITNATPSAISVTSGTAIVTTTSSAITISAIAADGQIVEYATTTTGVAITTSSAIEGTYDAFIEFKPGVTEAVIEITVSGDDYRTKVYTITIKKE